MALKVWLPLNKDTRNVGLQNIVMENHGATFSTNNNEKCCYFNGVQQWLQFNQKLGNFYNNDFSFCFWINPTDDTRSIIISEYAGTGASNIAIELRADRVLRLYWNGTPDKYFTTAGALTKNAWTHVSILKSGRNVWVYLNGVLKETYTNSSDFPTRTSNCYPRIGDDYRGNTGSTVSFQGYLRDFRMYDHLLNEEDIKRIYQKKIFDLVPYSGIKNVLFDRSGFMLMPLVNNNAVFQGSALYFNGTNARLRPKAGNVGFNLTGGTLSVWFTPKVIPTDYHLIFIDSTSQFGIGFYSSTQLLVTSNNASNTRKAIFPSTLTANTLNNVTVIYDNNYTAIQCIVNGESKTYNGTSRWYELNGLTIGGRTYNNTSLFNGKIHKVEIFKEQLSINDAIKHYNEERHMFLPDEYEELEYIQSTGTQYIDTGLKTKGEYLRITTKFLISSYNQSIRPFGSQKNTQCTIVPWPKNSDNPYGWLAIGTDYYVQTTSNSYFLTNINEDLFMDVIASNGTVKGHYCGYKLNSTYPGSIQNGYNNYIFASNRNGSPQIGGTQRLYFFKMYLEENVLAFNGIPAKRKSDNVIGMYDMVSKKFFTNAGTGSFTGA